ncbi:MAG: glucosyltransferase domain-containing protein, partial [Alphaproteobacteria bacterium]|nr:glucosyltransferase domain-containing protein [Alphaproteobacteria bacterium]
MNFIKKLDIRFKAIFVTTIVSLLAAHGMAIFYKLSFHDEAYSLFGVGATLQSGRWGLEILRRLSGDFFGRYGGSDVYSMPVMSCVYIIPLMSLSLYLIVKLLDIKKVLSCIMLAGLFITSFFFATLFLYNYTATYYIFAIFLSVAGAYLICACKKYYTYIAGIILMGLSLSIYQAFYPLAVSLILIYFIKEIAENKVSFTDFMKKGLYYGSAVVLAVLLYFVSVKVSVYLTGIPLCDYKNLDQMGSAGLMAYLNTIPMAYQKFLTPIVLFPFHTIYLYRFILLVMVILVIFKSVKLYKKGKLTLVQFI